MFDEVHRVCVQGVPKRFAELSTDYGCLLESPLQSCHTLRLGSIDFRLSLGLSTGSELQWGNWAAHELQL